MVKAALVPLTAALALGVALPATAGFQAIGVNGVPKIVARALPAVVSITARRIERDQFNKSLPKAGLGSGVILDRHGHILTNNHVVEGFEEFKITLPDGRTFRGTLVGGDFFTDLAVLKIDGENLRALPLGDSNRLAIGETVIAIGSPLWIEGGPTVTVGVISGKRRSMEEADEPDQPMLHDLLQTDAAINPGNSGGALINAKGELVGINTAIVSRTGGYQGIGFAVPSSMARQVIDSLVKYKKVVRGWLGVSIQDVTSDLAEEFNVRDLKGALVSGVMKGSPAEKAGIKQGDVILQFNGKTVEDTGHLRNMVSQTPVGSRVKVTVLRQKKELELEVAIAELPKKIAESPAGEGEPGEAPEEESTVLSGMSVRDLTPEISRRFGLEEGEKGVVVMKVETDSRVYEAGVRPGDVILQINQKSVATLEEYKKIVSKIKAKERILLLIRRKGQDLFVSIKPA